jgi:hypothetical protein
MGWCREIGLFYLEYTTALYSIGMGWYRELGLFYLEYTTALYSIGMEWVLCSIGIEWVKCPLQRGLLYFGIHYSTIQCMEWVKCPQSGVPHLEVNSTLQHYTVLGKLLQKGYIILA